MRSGVACSLCIAAASLVLLAHPAHADPPTVAPSNARPLVPLRLEASAHVHTRLTRADPATSAVTGPVVGECTTPCALEIHPLDLYRLDYAGAGVTPGALVFGAGANGARVRIRRSSHAGFEGGSVLEGVSIAAAVVGLALLLVADVTSDTTYFWTGVGLMGPGLVGSVAGAVLARDNAPGTERADGARVFDRPPVDLGFADRVDGLRPPAGF